MKIKIDYCKQCKRYMQCNKIDRGRGDKCNDYSEKQKKENEENLKEH